MERREILFEVCIYAMGLASVALLAVAMMN
jgi:hypothetical protein